MSNPFINYSIPTPVKAPPHQLADHCQRLCDKLGIPFCTVILRFLKKDEQLTESLVSYMAEKGIRNIHYLTKSFYAQRKAIKLWAK